MKHTYVVCYAIDTGELIDKHFAYDPRRGIEPALDGVFKIARENGTILWNFCDLDAGMTLEDIMEEKRDFLNWFAGSINGLSRLEILEAVHIVERRPRGNRTGFSPSLGLYIAAPVCCGFPIHGDF